MARRGGHGRQRDTFDIANDLEALLTPSIPSSPLQRPTSVFLPSPVGDRRRFDFNPPAVTAVTTEGIPAQIVHGTTSLPRKAAARSAPGLTGAPVSPRPVKRGPLFHGFRFASPEVVMICARRKVRREVLFALGRGGGGGRRRRGPYSDVSC